MDSMKMRHFNIFHSLNLWIMYISYMWNTSCGEFRSFLFFFLLIYGKFMTNSLQWIRIRIRSVWLLNIIHRKSNPSKNNFSVCIQPLHYISNHTVMWRAHSPRNPIALFVYRFHWLRLRSDFSHRIASHRSNDELGTATVWCLCKSTVDKLNCEPIFANLGIPTIYLQNGFMVSVESLCIIFFFLVNSIVFCSISEATQDFSIVHIYNELIRIQTHTRQLSTFLHFFQRFGFFFSFPILNIMFFPNKPNCFTFKWVLIQPHRWKDS